MFRAPASSLECCGLVSNDEFLSGSDDGSIELWTVQRKKPVCIVKNAHALLTGNNNFERKDSNRIPNGHLGNNIKFSSCYFWLSCGTFTVPFSFHTLVLQSVVFHTLHIWRIKIFCNV